MRFCSPYTDLLITFGFLLAQTPQPLAAQAPVRLPIMSPSQILDRAMTPFLDVRSDPENWSQTEKVAYEEMVKESYAGCESLGSTPLQGEDLYALAHLCSIGKDWQAAYTAASSYTKTDGPNLRNGFEILFQAELSLGNVSMILYDASEFIRRVPYDAASDAVLSSVIDSLQFSKSSEGVSMALLRQQKLLTALRGEINQIPYVTAAREAWQTIYILRYNQMDSQAVQQRHLLEAAMAGCKTAVCTDNGKVADKYRVQYEMVGTPFKGPLKPQSAFSPHIDTAYLYIDSHTTNTDALKHKVQWYRTSLKGPKANFMPVPMNLIAENGQLQYAQTAALRDVIDTLPFLVLTDSNHNVLFFGRCNLNWFKPGAQFDQLLVGAKKTN